MVPSTDNAASTLSTVYWQDEIENVRDMLTEDNKHNIKINSAESCTQPIPSKMSSLIIMKMGGKREKHLRTHSEMHVITTGTSKLTRVNPVTSLIGTQRRSNKSNPKPHVGSTKQFDASFEEEPRAVAFVNRCRTNSLDVALYDYYGDEYRKCLNRNSVPVRDLFRPESPKNRRGKIVERMNDIEKLTRF